MATTSWTLDNTIGALLIGVIFAIFLFGIITLQTHLYFRRFAASDPWKLKVLVGFIRVKIPVSRVGYTATGWGCMVRFLVVIVNANFKRFAIKDPGASTYNRDLLRTLPFNDHALRPTPKIV